MQNLIMSVPDSMWKALKDFLKKTGRSERYLGCHWTLEGDDLTPSEDRLCIETGFSMAPGPQASWAWVELAHKNPAIFSQFNFGSSKEKAGHWIIFDMKERMAFCAPKSEAAAFLKLQGLQKPKGPPHDPERIGP